jgi:hypothetical protein
LRHVCTHSGISPQAPNRLSHPGLGEPAVRILSILTLPPIDARLTSVLERILG